MALGIALTVYGREEEADELIKNMTLDQDPIIRYGGMYALALAYSGTANNKAIRQLLHFAVSDVSDDVRRTAVLALGFVMYSNPEQVWFREYSLSSLFTCLSPGIFFFLLLFLVHLHNDLLNLNSRLLGLSHCYLNLTIPMFAMVRLLQ